MIDLLLPQCPGCHKVTEFVECPRGSGASAYTVDGPAWCHRCLRRKIAEAVTEQPLWP